MIKSHKIIISMKWPTQGRISKNKNTWQQFAKAQFMKNKIVLVWKTLLAITYVWWYVVINDFLKITKATTKFVSLEKKPEKNSIELSNVHYRKNSCVSAGVAVCKFLWGTICSFSFEISIDKTFCHSIVIFKRPLQIFLAVIFFTHSICKLEFYQPRKKRC